ncbi:hypothetical protein HDU83_003480 [Entophlyctis luteolus]|nr:hypothetical protein HDU83_003480 [Entophlyctis luteolus]
MAAAAGFSARTLHPALGTRHPQHDSPPAGPVAQPLSISRRPTRNLPAHDRADGFASLNKRSASSSQASQSYLRAKSLLDNLSRSVSSTRSKNNSSSFLTSPVFAPLANQASNSNSQLAMSLSRSLGKSWTKDAFIEGSPLLPPSPSRDQQQFAMLEDKFCKDFSCCGTILENMHDLLQHYEEYHSRFEAGEDEFDSDEDDEDGFDVLGDDEYDHLPFGFDAMDNDMDMDMDEFDVISAQQQQEFNTAFLRAQIAAMTTNDHQQSLVMSQFPDASLFARTPPTIISRATVSSVLGAGTPLFNPNSTSHFSLIQKHDNQVDDFRIIASQQQQLPSLHMTPTQQISIHSEILLPSGNLDTTPSRHLNNNARGVLDPVTTAPKPTGLDLTETAPVVTPSKVGSMGDDPGGPLAFSANCDFANNSSRPFKCRVRRCGKEYKNANGLKYHMKNVHPVEEIVEIDANAACDKPYMCTADDCGKRYKNLNGLKHAHIDLLEGTDNTVVGE